MKARKVITLFLILFFVFSPLYDTFAQTLTLGKLLGKITKRQLTSIKKLAIIESYKGSEVSGTGKVKDALKTPGSDDKATIYLQKRFKGKYYQIVVIANRGDVAKIRKGKTTRFNGKFVGLSFDTLRFEDAEIIQRGW